MAYSSCWSDVLRSNWANLQLFIDLRTGSYQDLSSNVRVVTLTPAARLPQWGTRTRGKSLDLAGVAGATGYLSIPSAAELDLRPSGTIVLFPRSERGYGGAMRLAFKRNIGISCAYDLYDGAGAGGLTGILTAYDGATSHNLNTFSWPTTRSLAVSFSAGLVPTGYCNGDPLTPPATLWAGQADATALYLPGNSAMGVPGAGFWGWLFFSTRLTGAEIAQLHADFLQAPFAL
jgi:hypothetical protein